MFAEDIVMDADNDAHVPIGSTVGPVTQKVEEHKDSGDLSEEDKLLLKKALSQSAYQLLDIEISSHHL